LAAACFGEVTAATRELAVVAELVHLATLLHDDVVDDGQERRGLSTARRVWGNAVSVLAGDLLLTHSLERTSAVGKPEVLADLFATLRRLVDGEVIQLRGRTRLDVSEATYFRIVRDKTASLFGWAARAGAHTANATPAQVDALGRFGSHLGVAFQLVDDVLDYAGDPAATGKALFVDLEEGKLTLPLLRAIEARPALVADVEAARAGDGAAAARIAAVVAETKVCDAVRELARVETQSALDALSVAPPGQPRELLSSVAADLVARLG
jgi:octaprenyl-diphosphate synthase